MDVKSAREDSSKAARREEEKGNNAAHGCMEKEVRVWDLPYKKILDAPHFLDVMHITKNELALFSTCQAGPNMGRKQDTA
jgi:hypothetical protein